MRDGLHLMILDKDIVGKRQRQRQRKRERKEEINTDKEKEQVIFQYLVRDGLVISIYTKRKRQRKISREGDT